jgi:hypothetical protein
MPPDQELLEKIDRWPACALTSPVVRAARCPLPGRWQVRRPEANRTEPKYQTSERSNHRAVARGRVGVRSCTQQSEVGHRLRITVYCFRFAHTAISASLPPHRHPYAPCAFFALPPPTGGSRTGRACAFFLPTTHLRPDHRTQGRRNARRCRVHCSCSGTAQLSHGAEQPKRR